MKTSITKAGLTLRVIAGTHNAILGIDLQENKRTGCLGFSIERTDVGPAAKPLAASAQPTRWLPNMLTFPGAKADPNHPVATTDAAPLQKFRWGDYTLTPGSRYRYRVIPKYGKPGHLTTRADLEDGVEVEVTTEDPASPETAVFFNRGAAASEAFELKFPNVQEVDDLKGNSPDAVAARAWLSNGLEEALLAYLQKATGNTFALHAAVYEFQKPELLQALKAAVDRGVDVQVVVHHRQKNSKDTTASKNDAAIEAAGIKKIVTLRKAAPQDAIMHNKFVVLLAKKGHSLVPQAVWTGSTNWTAGGIYGQLNVGHAVYDPDVAAQYEQYFQLLKSDSDAPTMKHGLAALTPVSLLLPPGHKVTPIFSPQSEDSMLHLYANLCEGAKCLLVSAPFALSPIILAALRKKEADVLRYMLLDKDASLGKGQEVHVIEGDPSNSIAAATTLKSPLHDFQGELLEGKESFHHAGIHIHSKIIAVDPFGSDPIIVTGSANFCATQPRSTTPTAWWFAATPRSPTFMRRNSCGCLSITTSARRSRRRRTTNRSAWRSMTVGRRSTTSKAARRRGTAVCSPVLRDRANHLIRDRIAGFRPPSFARIGAARMDARMIVSLSWRGASPEFPAIFRADAGVVVTDICKLVK